jgi:cyclophilin family peptidyl-prolyl cis-trans isomerase
MKRWLLTLLVLGATCTLAQAKNPVLEIKTSMGTIKVELFEKESPTTVKNFLKYVDDKHYDGTIFHRVMKNFMVQGGGFKKDFTDATTLKDVDTARAKTGTPIKNEAANDVQNKKYTLAMARTNEADSATDQFFINTKDNDFLDRKSPKSDGVGYCVFGKVIDGADVVDKIEKVKTKSLPIKDRLGRPIFSNVPEKTVVIESIRRVDK